MPGYTYSRPHPAVAADIAVFTLRDGALSLLLIRRGGEPFKGLWALPGGFLRATEDLDACARRELREETGVDAPVLYPFGAFSAPDRDPRERVVSIAYLALLPSDSLALRAATDAAEVCWRRVDELPPLAFDHASIVAEALADLRRRLPGLSMLLALLPPTFTFAAVQQAYEAVMGRAVDRRNFRKQAMASGAIRETAGMVRGAHRPARLFAPA